jgi:ABC-type histidine transport system ATPase subunit
MILCRTQYSGEAKVEANRQIRQFRKDFMMVYQLNEGCHETSSQNQEHASH